MRNERLLRRRRPCGRRKDPRSCEDPRRVKIFRAAGTCLLTVHVRLVRPRSHACARVRAREQVHYIRAMPARGQRPGALGVRMAGDAR